METSPFVIVFSIIQVLKVARIVFLISVKDVLQISGKGIQKNALRALILQIWNNKKAGSDLPFQITDRTLYLGP